MSQSNIRFMVDVDNEKRFNIRNGEADEKLKDAIKGFRRYGDKLTLDIKQLGVLEVNSVIPSFTDKAILIKTTLILDYSDDIPF